MRKFFLYIFIIAPLVIAACGTKDKKGKGANANNGTPQKQPPLSVDAMIVASSTLNAQIEIPGTILANESTEIHPESSGRLVLLYSATCASSAFEKVVFSFSEINNLLFSSW